MNLVRKMNFIKKINYQALRSKVASSKFLRFPLATFLASLHVFLQALLALNLSPKSAFSSSIAASITTLESAQNSSIVPLANAFCPLTKILINFL